MPRRTRPILVGMGVVAVVVASVLTLIGGGRPVSAPNQNVFAGPSPTVPPRLQAPNDGALNLTTDYPIDGQLPAGATEGAAATTEGDGGTGGGAGGGDTTGLWDFGGEDPASFFGDDWWDFDELWNGGGGGEGSAPAGETGEGSDPTGETGDPSSAPTTDSPGTSGATGPGTDDGASGSHTLSAPTAGGGSQGRIAFAATSEGNEDIYAVDPDDENLARLTDAPGSDRQPAWSPDGSRLAFVTDRAGSPEVFVMNPDGSAPTPLTGHGGSPAHPTWSGDGQTIAFESTEPATGGREIYAVRVEDGTLQRLTWDSGATTASTQPAFSPDGSQIAFVRVDGSSRHLVVMAADGSDGRSVGGGGAANPAWSSDGARLAYNATDGIHVLDVAAGTDTTIPGTVDLGEPDWAPDGTQLVVRDASGQLYLIDFDGARRSHFTTGLTSAGPDWL
ncbi:MAG: hypothetical protein M3144_07420 [Actinomycetota bacterium]|nr:hypothetical protein [Actinomycetota bacterium]